MAKVSIIVPVYNVEEYLENCVRSLTDQTLNDIEIILVDDGSPDNCPVICDRLAATDNRIKVIHKPNGGVSAARNDGCKQAVGDYVIFCDSDDWMEKDAVEKLYDKAVETSADIIIGDVYQVRGESKHRSVFYEKDFVTDDRSFIDELIKADIYRTYCPIPPKEGPAFGYGGPWNKLVKRSLLISNDIYFDLRVKGIFDDILYTAHILAAANKIAYISVPVYNYRIIDTSITHSFKPNVLEINDAIFNSWREFFAEQNSAGKFNEAFYACIIRRLEESIRTYFVNKKNTKTKHELRIEYKKVVAFEPYATALRNVNLKKISKKQKLIVILSRLNFVSLLWKIY